MPTPRPPSFQWKPMAVWCFLFTLGSATAYLCWFVGFALVWELCRVAALITVRSTFSTSVPAIARDIIVPIYILLRLYGKGILEMLKTKRHSAGRYAIEGGFLFFFPFFAYNLKLAIDDINNKADECGPPIIATLKRLTKPPLPPIWAYEPTSPRIDFSLTALEGFTFEVTPRYFDLSNKKEYSLLVMNSGTQPVKAVDIRVQFPYLVEAHNIVTEEGVTGISFEPIGLSWTIGSIGGGGGHIEVKGCPATSSYRLHADAMLPKGKAEILFILNSSSESAEETGGPPKAILQKWGPATFIHGHFWYDHKGRATEGSYYAPIELGENKIIGLGRSRVAPHSLLTALVFDFLPAPCLSEKLALPH